MKPLRIGIGACEEDGSSEELMFISSEVNLGAGMRARGVESEL